ncbi:MAG: glycogen/starch synthase [Flavobacteriales bacterium]|nr:glycogen/starch synthase [Flavobacteriales bacterium]
MDKPKVLFVSQEISPYVAQSDISDIARNLPQGIKKKGKEIRIFMPRYGCINERRHQLHEVIRLSGMNIIIDDMDHPLIIKVASIQPERIQVYFIDSEDYFQRKFILHDAKDKFFKDNDERAIFFCRGVAESIRKLGWAPDVIHCQGWMTALLPLYIKKVYKDDPIFANSKVVYSAYDNGFEGSLNSKFAEKALVEEVELGDLELVKDPSFENLNKIGIAMSDAVIKGSNKLGAELDKFIASSGKLVLDHPGDDYIDAYSEFYDQVMASEEVLS